MQPPFGGCCIGLASIRFPAVGKMETADIMLILKGCIVNKFKGEGKYLDFVKEL